MQFLQRIIFKHRTLLEVIWDNGSQFAAYDITDFRLLNPLTHFSGCKMAWAFRTEHFCDPASCTA